MRFFDVAPLRLQKRALIANRPLSQRRIGIVQRLPRSFPKTETYALSDQLRRAVISVPANIAEGQARQHKKEFLQFLSVAKGSLAETHTLVIVAGKLNYVDNASLTQIEADIAEIAKMLAGLTRRL